MMAWIAPGCPVLEALALLQLLAVSAQLLSMLPAAMPVSMACAHILGKSKKCLKLNGFENVWNLGAKYNLRGPAAMPIPMACAHILDKGEKCLKHNGFENV